MANFNLYLTSLVLLVALSWRSSSGVPIQHQPSGLDCFSSTCLSSLSKTLLQTVSELMKDDKFEGEECTVLDVDSMMKSQTVQVCAPKMPQNSACTSQRSSPFNERECLENIMKDLSFYHDAFQTYNVAQSALSTQPLTSAPNSPTEQLLLDTMGTIQKLKNCCQVPDEGDHSSQERLVWTTTSPMSTFDNKIKMCKVLKAFRSRAITISRAVGYISSGDHKK